MSEKKPFVLRIDPEKLKAWRNGLQMSSAVQTDKLSTYSIRLSKNQEDGKQNQKILKQNKNGPDIKIQMS